MLEQIKEIIREQFIPKIIIASRAILALLVRSFCHLFNMLVIRRERRVISYLIITIVVTLFSVFKCEHTSTDSSYKRQSINFFLDNEMSNLEQTEAFDRSIETFMRRWELTGGSFAIMRNDSLLYAKGYGFADREQQKECDVNNVFRIASASKLITATAVMKLIEEGRLSLNTQVFGRDGILCDSTFLNIRDWGITRIKVEHLLRHTSGLKTSISDPAFANYSVARALGKELPLSLDDMVEYASQQKLKYSPGGTFDYSNLGYMILTKLIEKVSGCNYESYVQENILAPAGCYDIYIGENFRRDRDKNEVLYYEVKEAEKVAAYDGSGRMTMRSDGGNNVTLLSGAGGWVASPVEMLRFVASINGSGSKEDILSKESIKTMTYDSTNRSKKPIGWATVRGKEWIRSGSMAGTFALIKQQKDGYTWVFLTNSSAWIAYHLGERISNEITKSVSKVKGWPERDLFECRP